MKDRFAFEMTEVTDKNIETGTELWSRFYVLPNGTRHGPFKREFVILHSIRPEQIGAWGEGEYRNGKLEGTHTMWIGPGRTQKFRSWEYRGGEQIEPKRPLFDWNF